MSLTKNLSLVLVCLAVGFVAYECAPTLENDALLSQILNLGVSDLEEETQLVRQIETPEEQKETGELVEPSDEEVNDEEVDLIDDEDWDGIWNPDWGNDEGQNEEDLDEEEDDDYWVGDDDWEDDFDYIENKETADDQS